MTDNEIIKAFEACYTNKYTDCDECPYYCRKENRCVDMIVDGVPTLPKNILDLINRLKAELDESREKNAGLALALLHEVVNEDEQLRNEITKVAKSEARKEFALQLEAEIISSDKYIREYDDSEVQKAYNKGLRDALKILKEMG